MGRSEKILGLRKIHDKRGERHFRRERAKTLLVEGAENGRLKVPGEKNVIRWRENPCCTGVGGKKVCVIKEKRNNNKFLSDAS